MAPFKADSYIKLIREDFRIVNKEGLEVPFTMKEAQDDFIKNITGRDIILKARQLGFSALILAIATVRFIYSKNERIVCISHETSATQRLLDRVKFYINCFEQKAGAKIPMKYNSRSEMAFTDRNNSFYIGSAGSKEFGRGDTITFLHLSEAGFYENMENLFAGVMQAVTPNGLVFIESTANGFNFFRDFWMRTKLNETGFKDHFYNPKWEYGEAFLEQKKKELQGKFPQEYPMTDVEAFITSGNLYFDNLSLRYYLENIKEQINSNLVYV